MTPQRLVALVSLVALFACGREAPEEVESATVVPVTTEPAVRGGLRAVIHATGIVTPAPGAELMVSAPEPARIAEIPPAEGDRVRRGDLLVRFEVPALAAEVAGRRAEIARAAARLANAQAAQTRARDLFDRGVAARKEVEDADREVADAEADRMAAQAALAAAEANASRATVRATFDGIVAQRAHNPGDFVEATAADPVLRVVDPRRLEVNAAIPLADVPRVVLGATAHLSGPTNGATTSPALRVVSRPAAVTPGTASVPVRLAFVAAGAGLAAGTPVEVDLDAEEHRDVVLCPAAAIVREGEETAVMIAKGDHAERRPVVLGLRDAHRVEVLSGLAPGEAVIIRGQAGLPDGAAIQVAAVEK